jgi:heme/copper-type cytochrome/quinol oxidase subunit 2
MAAITDFHDHLMLFIVFMVFFVTYLLLTYFDNKKDNPNDPKAFTYSIILEMGWEALKIIVTIIMAIYYLVIMCVLNNVNKSKKKAKTKRTLKDFKKTKPP